MKSRLALLVCLSSTMRTICCYHNSKNSCSRLTVQCHCEHVVRRSSNTYDSQSRPRGRIESGCEYLIPSHSCLFEGAASHRRRVLSHPIPSLPVIATPIAERQLTFSPGTSCVLYCRSIYYTPRPPPRIPISLFLRPQAVERLSVLVA